MASFLGSYSDCFALFGAAAVSYLALKLSLAVWSGIRAYFLASKARLGQKLKSYGSWAVVTGATDGIGKAYAQEIASLGLNVVLVSRSPEKLADVAAEIESRYKVQTKVISVDFTGGLEIYDKVRKELGTLEIGTLVNNVGMGYYYPEYLCEIPEDKTVADLINVNIYSVTLMTRVVLPQMVQRKKGAVINISSGSAINPTPFLTVYSAAKSYVDFFSRALQLEYADKGITVQVVKPFFVATKMSKIRKASFFAPSPSTYVKSALCTLGVQESTYGCLSHAVQGWITERMALPIVNLISVKSMKAARKSALRKLAQKKSQ